MRKGGGGGVENETQQQKILKYSLGIALKLRNAKRGEDENFIFL